MLLIPPDYDSHTHKTRFFKWLQVTNLLVTTIAILAVGLWALVYHFWYKNIYVPGQASLHINQDITLLEGEARKKRIPISVEFSVQNTGERIAYLLPGAFIAKGLIFKDDKVTSGSAVLKSSLSDVLNSNDYYKIMYREKSLFDHKVGDISEKNHIWFIKDRQRYKIGFKYKNQAVHPDKMANASDQISKNDKVNRPSNKIITSKNCSIQDNGAAYKYCEIAIPSGEITKQPRSKLKLIQYKPDDQSKLEEKHIYLFPFEEQWEYIDIPRKGQKYEGNLADIQANQDLTSVLEEVEIIGSECNLKNGLCEDITDKITLNRSDWQLQDILNQRNYSGFALNEGIETAEGDRRKTIERLIRETVESYGGEVRYQEINFENLTQMSTEYTTSSTFLAGNVLFVGHGRMLYRTNGESIIYQPIEPAMKFEQKESIKENFLFFVPQGKYDYIQIISIIPFVSKPKGTIWSRVTFDVDRPFMNVIPCKFYGRISLINKHLEDCKDIEPGNGHTALDDFEFTPVVTIKYLPLKNGSLSEGPSEAT